MERAVNAVRHLHELCVTSLLHDPAFLEDENGIGLPNRRETVGNDECCSAFHKFPKGIFDEMLRFHIKRGCRLVEDQDIGIAQECARERDPLFLADGQLDAAPSDDLPVFLGGTLL